MGKIFKYEWRKQLFSKIVIGGILLGLSLIFAIGTFADKEGWMQFAMIALAVCGMFGSMFVGIESLLVLNRDLRTKESHMLFMVPYSSYRILGAKILAAFCQIILTFALFGAAFALCFTSFLAANNDIAEILNMIQAILNDFAEMDLSWSMIGLVLGELLVGWITMIAVGYAAIITSRTILADSKFATAAAVILFLLINWGMTKLSGAIMDLSAGTDLEWRYFAINIAVNAVCAAILLILSGWMAEKKLSV